jgi:hypothetical protein
MAALPFSDPLMVSGFIKAWLPKGSTGPAFQMMTGRCAREPWRDCESLPRHFRSGGGSRFPATFTMPERLKR